MFMYVSVYVRVCLCTSVYVCIYKYMNIVVNKMHTTVAIKKLNIRNVIMSKKLYFSPSHIL